jgi:outer membrane biosynthesis protein TonB
LALAGTVLLHAAVLVALWGGPASRRSSPPIYSVQLVAAPAPEANARPAPAVVARPAEQVVPISKKPPIRKSSMAKTPPPPAAPSKVPREAAPRATAQKLAPGVQPSTGTDVANINTGGIAFPFQEYLDNIVAQVYKLWTRPTGNAALKAEMFFLVHRDGSITQLQFTKRSGDFAFDLEAQGAIEAAGNGRLFGPLPKGYASDVLPVRFFFDPGSLR